jgi:hypothetical protein
MWYKFAKQGSVWSRIGSDAEAQFDALLDAATKTSGGDRKKYINIYELDKLFRKSKLKDMIIRFIKLQTDPGFLGAFQRSVFPNIEKLAFFEKIIPYFFANKIHVPDKFNNYDYHEQRTTLKHEMAHAINSHTIPEHDSDIYTSPGIFFKREIGKSARQTDLLILFRNIEKNLFAELKSFLETKIPSFYQYMYDGKINLNDRLLTLEKAWKEFENLVKNRQISLHEKSMKSFYKISGDNLENRVTSRLINRENLSLEKINSLLHRRSQTLADPESDLYYADPEETRAHFIEVQNLFSLPLLLEYYKYVSEYYENESDPEQKYLEDIKKMFNMFVGIRPNARLMSDRYFSPSSFSNHFGLYSTYNLMIIKMNDEKFREQVAKHLNNVYQRLNEAMSALKAQKQEVSDKPEAPENNKEEK